MTIIGGENYFKIREQIVCRNSAGVLAKYRQSTEYFSPPESLRAVLLFVINTIWP